MDRSAAALRVQVERDFAAFWNLSCEVHVTQSPAPGDWQLVVLDDSSAAWVFGYHDQRPAWPPYALVFARSDGRAGLDWRVTFSHEGLEMLANPWVRDTMWAPPDQFAFREVCDPVQADRDAYSIGGVPVSNFVTQAWFTGDAAAGVQWDYRALLSGPGEFRPGGFLSYYSPEQRGWIVRSREAPGVRMRTPRTPRA